MRGAHKNKDKQQRTTHNTRKFGEADVPDTEARKDGQSKYSTEYIAKVTKPRLLRPWSWQTMRMVALYRTPRPARASREIAIGSQRE